MTKTELYDVWKRYMHRNDLSADLDTTYTLASERVSERLLIETPDMAAILANSPRMLVHAGLICLNELAQDDDGGARETQLLDAAVRDYHLRNSLNTDASPQMEDPRYAP